MKSDDYILKLDDILKITRRKPDEPPTEEAMGKVRRQLAMCGYADTNSTVYNALVKFGARVLEEKATRGLFLRGACGIGKTLGVQILAACYGWPVYSAKQIQRCFIEEKAADFYEWIDATDFHGHPRTIVIDDIGSEDLPIMKYGTPTNVIADVLDRRYSKGFLRDGVMTVATCNLDDAALMERYGERINDRLNEMFEFVNVTGRSLR